MKEGIRFTRWYFRIRRRSSVTDLFIAFASSILMPVQGKSEDTFFKLVLGMITSVTVIVA